VILVLNAFLTGVALYYGSEAISQFSSLFIVVIAILNFIEIYLFSENGKYAIKLVPVIKLYPMFLYSSLSSSMIYFLSLYIIRTYNLYNEFTKQLFSPFLIIYFVWILALITTDLFFRGIAYLGTGIDDLVKARILFLAMIKKIDDQISCLDKDRPFSRKYVRWFKDGLNYFNDYLSSVLPDKMILKNVEQYYKVALFYVSSNNKEKLINLKRNLKELLSYMSSDAPSENLEGILRFLSNFVGKQIRRNETYKLYEMLEVKSTIKKLKSLKYDYLIGIISLLVAIYATFFK